MHTYDDRPCADCGDLDGCHIPGKVRRTRGTAKYAQAFPKVVCLCGSTRFKAAWYEWTKRITYEGDIVLGVGDLNPNQQDTNDPIDPALKAALDELHKRKIDMADEIFVLNVGGYVGQSTRGEIDYASAAGKKVRWLEPPQ
jgi:hypothetical protein